MARKNENVQEQRVVDSEGQTAPAGGTQQAQPAQQQPEQAQPAQGQQAEARQEQREVSGPTSIKYVGRGSRFADGENEYEQGEVVEVDADTANRLLSSKDTRGQQQFVQAD